MDDERFDALTRALTSSTSRRRLLRGLAGGLLASLAAMVGAVETLASHTGCRHHGQPCRRKNQCCSHRCTGAGTCMCPAAKTPCGTTACCDPATQKCCQGVCVPLGGCCTAADCDDGNACTVDSCDSATGAITHTPDNSLCGTGGACDATTGCTCAAGYEPCPTGCCPLVCKATTPPYYEVCGGRATCVCVTTTEGGQSCADDTSSCVNFPSCTSSATCSSGSFCATNTNCSGGRCIPRCPPP